MKTNRLQRVVNASSSDICSENESTAKIGSWILAFASMRAVTADGEACLYERTMAGIIWC
jgi:hypothetical protein